MDQALATAFAETTSHTVSIRGSHAGSSSAAALSRQLGVRMADDKELLAADIVFVATPPAARSTVMALAKEIGFEGVDAGHLDASRNIENLAWSWHSFLRNGLRKPRYAACVCSVVSCSTLTCLADEQRDVRRHAR